MEEILSIIMEGCRKAREVESNLQALSEQPPNVLFNSCYEMVRLFESAMNGMTSLMIMNSSSSSSSYPFPTPTTGQEQQHQWGQLLSYHHASTNEQCELTLMDISTSLGAGNGADEIHRVGEKESASDYAGKKTSTPVAGVVQRTRNRKGGAEKRTIRVAAGPRQGGLTGGNYMEIPPDDGFTWRKYGQKEILGSTFPRGYYRCTHKNFYGCQAKKQVQRLDHHPDMFEVTYYGHHTCSFSAPFMGYDRSNTNAPAANAATKPSGDTGTSAETIGKEEQDEVPTRSDIIGREAEGRSQVIELINAIFSSAENNRNSLDSIFPPIQPHD